MIVQSLTRSDLPSAVNRAVVCNANGQRGVGLSLTKYKWDDTWKHSVAKLAKKALPSHLAALELNAFKFLKTYPQRQSLYEGVIKYFSPPLNRTVPFNASDVDDYLEFMYDNRTRQLSPDDETYAFKGNTGLPHLRGDSQGRRMKLAYINEMERFIKSQPNISLDWSNDHMCYLINGQSKWRLYPWFVWSRLENKLRPVFNSDHSEIVFTPMLRGLKSVVYGYKGWGGQPLDLKPNRRYFWWADYSRFDISAIHLLDEINYAFEQCVSSDYEASLIPHFLRYVFKGPVLFSSEEPDGKRVINFFPEQWHGLMSGSIATSLIGSFVNSLLAYLYLRDRDLLKKVDFYYMGDDLLFNFDDPEIDFSDFPSFVKQYGMLIKPDETSGGNYEYGHFLQMYFTRGSRWFPSVRIFHSVLYWERPFNVKTIEKNLSSRELFNTRLGGKLMNVRLNYNVPRSYWMYTRSLFKILSHVIRGFVPLSDADTIKVDRMEWWDKQKQQWGSPLGSSFYLADVLNLKFLDVLSPHLNDETANARVSVRLILPDVVPLANESWLPSYLTRSQIQALFQHYVRSLHPSVEAVAH